VIERPLSTADEPDPTQQVAAALTLALGVAVAQMGEEVASKIAPRASAPLPLTEPSGLPRATSERARP
jgi:hypothetical protein